MLQAMLLAAAIGPGAASAGATLVQDVRVFDGERMHAMRSVLFDEGSIVNADFRGPAPAGTTLVKGAGRTLLPGLIDAKASLAAAQVELSARVESFALPAAVENVLSLALREAVTNIVRHAGAARCEVSLALVDGVIVFRIADDGARLTSLAKLCHGNGLNGMHERIRALGGKLALRVERGLALELSLPMGAQA